MECHVFIAMSLDGFIAREGGGLDWLSSVERPGEDYGYRTFHDSIDTLIVGRRTYDAVLGFDEWPWDGKRVVVLTRRAPEPRHGETFHDGPPEPLVARLAAEGARRAYVDGGVVIQQFLRAGLVDELTISVIPLLLGAGVRLFGETGRDVPLALVDSRAFASGLVQLRYRPTSRAP